MSQILFYDAQFSKKLKHFQFSESYLYEIKSGKFDLLETILLTLIRVGVLMVRFGVEVNLSPI